MNPDEFLPTRALLGRAIRKASFKLARAKRDDSFRASEGGWLWHAQAWAIFYFDLMRNLSVDPFNVVKADLFTGWGHPRAFAALKKDRALREAFITVVVMSGGVRDQDAKELVDWKRTDGPYWGPALEWLRARWEYVSDDNAVALSA